MASPPHRLHSTASCAYKRGTPPWSPPPSSSSAHFNAPAPPRTLPCSPLLSHRGLPLRHLSNPPTLPQAPHRHREPPDHLAGALNYPFVPPPLLTTAQIAPLWAARFQWALSLPTPKSSPLVTGLLPSHSTADHRPSAGQILPASRWCRWGRKPPLVLPRAERLRWARPSPIQMGWATVEAACLHSALCQFHIRLNLINSNKIKSNFLIS
jgi:hypothetical protein